MKVRTVGIYIAEMTAFFLLIIIVTAVRYSFTKQGDMLDDDTTSVSDTLRN